MYKALRLLRIKSRPFVPLRDTRELPTNTAAVYYVMQGWKLLYVGKTLDLWERWNSQRFGEHHKMAELVGMEEEGGAINIYYRKSKPYEVGFIEALEMRRFKPPLNKRMESIWANINARLVLDWVKDWSFPLLFCVGLVLAVAIL